MVAGCYVLAWLLWAVVTRWVAYHCGRRRKEGLWLGFLLGPLGLVIELALPRFPEPGRAERQQWELP